MKTESNYRYNHSYSHYFKLLPSIIILTGLFSGMLFTQNALAQEQFKADYAKFELAVPYLDTLAQKRSQQRKITGGLATGAGVVTGIWGAALMSKGRDENAFFSDYDFGSLLLISGATYTIGGIIMLSVKTKQEKLHREVMDISNPEQRAYAADQALKELAKSARTGRIIGTGFSILGIAYFMASDEPDRDLFVSYLAGTTIVNLFTKSLDERTLRDYQKRSQYSGRTDFSIGAGLHPSGSGILQINVSF